MSDAPNWLEMLNEGTDSRREEADLSDAVIYFLSDVGIYFSLWCWRDECIDRGPCSNWRGRCECVCHDE